MTETDPVTERILKECGDLSKIINDDFMAEFARIHNIKPENNRLSLKQEILAEWGYFLTVKKKYALHITNEEGVPVDKLDTKGLITRRSDYPKFSKEKIAQLIDMLVMHKTQNYSEITKFVEDTKHELMGLIKTGDKRIARPASYSRPFGEYAKAPYQIVAMELWNELEYNHFVHGTKGYLFEIITVDFNSAPDRVKSKQRFIDSKYIALPYEVDFLPPYYIINQNAMIEFCWTKRVSELLEGPLKSKILDKGRLTTMDLELKF